MVSAKKNRLKRVLIIILAVLMTHCAVSMVVTKVVYDSIFERYDPEPAVLSKQLQEMVNQRQEHSYDCQGNTLAGYFYDGGQRGTLIVLAPGFHAGGDDYLPQIHSLLQRGWSVFTFDPTGSGDSTGDSYEGFPQEIIDLDATLNYIEARDLLGFQNIALIGHSRGGYAAGCILGYEHRIAAMVSISGVDSAMDAIMSYSTDYVGPLAYGNYGFLWAYQAMLFGTELTGMQAHEQIAESHVPVLLVQGSEDPSFPPEEYSIYAHRDQIQRDGVEYLLMEQPGQNGHTDLLFDGQDGANEALMEHISTFLEKATHEER